ncbi:MAG: hypothetical protein ACRERD_13470 [Candidatus Binatia bacterium]
MSQIVEVNEDGGLYLPAKVLEDMKPHRRFVVRPVNGMLILQPEEEALPFWATATAEEWIKGFHEWVNEPRPEAPVIPLEALRRENFYED